MQNNKTSSYTAASGGFPIKIFKNLDLISAILNHKVIKPIHIQLNPTNKCNLSCSFCSCSERDRSLQLSKERLNKIFTSFSILGCRSVTITGGGEPLMLKDLPWLVNESIKLGIAVGLVTNGYLLKKEHNKTLESTTWVRISVSDESDWDKLSHSIKPLIGVSTDWSFSYVVSENPNMRTLSDAIKFANEHNFTHVRVVNDILKPVTNLTGLRMAIVESGVNDKLVVWQDRQSYTTGAKRCLISLMKPVVGADGFIYPCCGTQYAQSPPDRDYGKSMRMGVIDNIGEMWSKQAHYDGSNCMKCYYSNYNDSLSGLIDEIDHHLFV